MSNLWKDKAMVRLRMRVKYWANQLRRGRNDTEAINKYLTYSEELEAFRAAWKPKIDPPPPPPPKVVSFEVTFP